MRFFSAFALLLALAAPRIALAASSETVGTFVTPHGSLTYTAYGTGPTVIVVAGGPGLNAAYLAPLARELAADGFRAVLYDQRGTGRSAAAGAGANRALLTQAGTVADLEALRVALHEDRVRFVTHSFGGGIALAYAAAYPKHVATMVLIGSVGTDLSTVGRFGAILMKRLSPSERAAYARAQKTNDASKALDIQLLAEFDDRKKALATIAAEPHPFIYPAVSSAVFTNFARTYHVGHALTALDAPVTLLTGADDAARAMEDSLRAALPRASHVYIAHSGHWPWIENPTDFDAALRAALRV